MLNITIIAMNILKILLLFLKPIYSESLLLNDQLKENLATFLSMAINAYEERDLDTTISKFRSDSGLVAKAYDYKFNIVLAFKGTSLSLFGYYLNPTAPMDKFVDLLLYDCNSDDKENIIYLEDAKIWINYLKSRFPNRKIILTGHSLGGTIASLMGNFFKIPAYAFASPGEKRALKKMNIEEEYHEIFHFGSCSDPIYNGACAEKDSICSIAGYTIQTKCHSGIAYCLSNQTQNNILHHRAEYLLYKIEKTETLYLKEDEDGCLECLPGDGLSTITFR